MGAFDLSRARLIRVEEPAAGQVFDADAVVVVRGSEPLSPGLIHLGDAVNPRPMVRRAMAPLVRWVGWADSGQRAHGVGGALQMLDIVEEQRPSEGDEQIVPGRLSEGEHHEGLPIVIDESAGLQCIPTSGCDDDLGHVVSSLRVSGAKVNHIGAKSSAASGAKATGA